MSDKEIFNQIENNSQNEEIPDFSSNKSKEKRLESTIRGSPDIELVEPPINNSDVESKRKKLKKDEEKEEFNYLFDEDGNNYHSSVKDVDDNSTSSEKIGANFDFCSINQNNDKDTRLLLRKTARKESNDSEK